jgi:hypothetical protein
MSENLLQVEPSDLVSTTNLEPGEVAVQIYEALADNQWEFRTVKGITEEKGLPPEVVQNVLDRNLDKTVRVSLVPSKNGDLLYTLKSRPPTLREKVAELHAAAS